MEDTYYFAMFDGWREIIDKPSKIALYEERCAIARATGDGCEIVYTPGDGWLIDRPTDEELCGIEVFSMPIADVKTMREIVSLSLVDPDAARAAIAAMEGE